MMKTMNTNYLGGVAEEYYVAAITKDSPSHEEWQSMLQTVKNHNIKASLVYTDGGYFIAMKRRQSRDFLIENKIEDKIHGAILTKSLLVRNGITALNVFIKDLVTPFAPEDIDLALEYLQIPHEVRPQMKNALAALKDQLEISL
jgi:hypothetical protein